MATGQTPQTIKPDDEWVDTTDEWVDVQPAAPARFSNPQGFTAETMPGQAQWAPASTRFLGAAAEMADVRPLLSAIANPIDTAKGLIGAQVGQFKKAWNAPTWTEAAGHTMAGLLPVLGPMAANIGEQIGSGDVAGGIGAASVIAAPYAKQAVKPLASPLKQSAAQSIQRVLNPTTGPAKARTARIAPTLAERGPMAMTQRGYAGKLGQRTEAAGEALEAGYAAQPIKHIQTQQIIDAIEQSKRSNDAVIAGVSVEPALVEAADQLKAIVQQFGPTIASDSLVKLRQRWDKSVAQSKGFTQPDIAMPAAVKRDAVSAIRDVLNQEFPDIQQLNAEYSLWKNAQDVMDATVQRKLGQAVPMGEQLATAAGAAGGMGGGVGGAIAGAAALRGLTKIMRSTAWRTVSAKTKNELANALMSGTERFKALVIAKAAAEVSKEEQRQMMRGGLR